jgi:hypothetical protein
MEALEWKWSVVAVVHPDANVELSVEAGGRRLLPAAHLLPPLEVVPSLMAVLTPFAPHDSICVEIRDEKRLLRKWKGKDVGAAISWLADELPRAPGPHGAPLSAFQRPTTTGIRLRPVPGSNVNSARGA